MNFYFKPPNNLEENLQLLQLSYHAINLFLIQENPKSLNIAYFMLRMNDESINILLKHIYDKETDICLEGSKDSLNMAQIIEVIACFSQYLEKIEIRDVYAKYITLIDENKLIKLVQKIHLLEKIDDKSNPIEYLLSNLLAGVQLK